MEKFTNEQILVALINAGLPPSVVRLSDDEFPGEAVYFDRKCFVNLPPQKGYVHREDFDLCVGMHKIDENDEPYIYYVDARKTVEDIIKDIKSCPIK